MSNLMVSTLQICYLMYYNKIGLDHIFCFAVKGLICTNTFPCLHYPL